jgi:hypothetical protein
VLPLVRILVLAIRLTRLVKWRSPRSVKARCLADEGTHHAVDHSLAIDCAGEDPDRRGDRSKSDDRACATAATAGQ